MKSISTILASMAIFGCAVVNAQTAPGGVAGAALWLKGDLGVTPKTGLDTVLTWHNYGAAGGDAGQLGTPIDKAGTGTLPNVVLPTFLTGVDNKSGFNYNPGINFTADAQLGDMTVELVPGDAGDFDNGKREIEFYQVYTIATNAGGKLFGVDLKAAAKTDVRGLDGSKNMLDWNNLRAGHGNNGGNDPADWSTDRMGSVWSYGKYTPGAPDPNSTADDNNSGKAAGTQKYFNPGWVGEVANITRVSFEPQNDDINNREYNTVTYNNGIENTFGVGEAWVGNGGYTLGTDRTLGGDDDAAKRVTAEVIAFPSKLSAEDRAKIQTYLAVKYGFTLPQDYVSSNGTTDVWNQTTNAGYNNNITSIGKDNASGLVQKQSVSINKQNTGNYTILTLGSALAGDNQSPELGTVTNDQSFMTFGDNGADITATQAEPVKLDGFSYTLKQRVWKVQKANWDDQTIALTVNPNQTTKPVAIVIASDANFTENVQVIDLTDGAASFNSSELPDGYYFTYADAKDVVTPVAFASQLAAKAVNGGVQLTWATATEVNNSGFAVERSSDAQHFVAVDFVATKAVNGNSTSAINYSFNDNNLAAGTYYYRLAQTDRNGQKANTEVVVVSVNANGAASAVVLYPNPVQSAFKIRNAAAGSAYRIVNLAGQNVQAGILSGANAEINVANLAAGIYFVELSKDGQTTVKLKFVKQ